MNVRFHIHAGSAPEANPATWRVGLTAAMALLLLVTGLIPAASQVKEEDILFEALSDELVRSVDRLMLEDQERPYFVEYRVRDKYGFNVRSTFGAIVHASPIRSRRLAVSLRIGDYEFDNAGFLSRDDIFSSFRNIGGGTTILDDDYMALRRDLWLATDDAYKEAVQQFAAKNAFLASRVVEDTLLDFSREEPVSYVEPRGNPGDIDTTQLKDRARSWSELFRDHPEVMESEVILTVSSDVDYIFNSEGTRVRDKTDNVNITITASTKAADGMKISQHRTLACPTVRELPSDDKIEAVVNELANALERNREADVLEELYIGPVLLVDEAACDYIDKVLVPHMSGSRLPLLGDEQFSNFLGTKSELATRIDRRVMSKSLSVTDNPTLCQFDGMYLHGCYDVDAQGVEPSVVQVVENGIARNLLYSRRPGKQSSGSTGHGRGFDAIGVAPSVVVVESSEGLPEEQLIEQFRHECADFGLDYGIVLRRLGSVREGSFSGGGISVIMGGSGADGSVSSDGWKVYVDDGRVEPVRGLSVKASDFRTMRDILAVGSDPTVLNTQSRVQGVPMLEGSVPISIIAPPMLLEEIEIAPVDEKNAKPALLTHPYFSK